MNNTKLINILRTFSKSEMKEFEKFISSPYFNRGRNYIPLLNRLKKFYPKFDDERLTPEYIYSKLYPSKKFNRQVIWNTTSLMTGLAEEFLLHLSLKKNKFVREQSVADEYLERKLAAYYNKKLTEMESALDSMGISDSYFRYKIQLESGKMSYHFLEDTQQFLPEHVLRKGEYVILNFMRDISDTIGSLRVCGSMYNKKFEVNLPHAFINSLDLKNIAEYAKKNKFKYAPLIEMYYVSILQSMEYHNTEHFFRLKELFEQNYHLFPKEEKYLWSAELTNYCVQKINEGNDSFRKTIFEMDRFNLKEDIAYINKFIPKLLYVQILGNALGANETEWGRKYIEEYIPRLKPSYQKPMRAFSYAYLFFKLKDYNKVLENLGKVEFIDSMDKLLVRSLYIRAYYELGEMETLRSYLDSTRHFLEKNTSVGNTLRNNYKKFLGCLNTLIAASENKDEFELSRLEKLLKTDSTIALNEWLLEKVYELSRSIKAR